MTGKCAIIVQFGRDQVLALNVNSKTKNERSDTLRVQSTSKELCRHITRRSQTVLQPTANSNSILETEFLNLTNIHIQ